MSDDAIKDVLLDALDVNAEGIDYENLSLEALILLINTERLKHLQEKTEKEFKELRERQDKVKELHDILKAINAATKDDGKLDISKNEELQAKIERAKELGADIPDDKTKFNREERDRMVENIRMTIEDMNVQNDMQLQTISRLTNERYESYQMARSILKPLHEAKSSLARGIRGAS